MIDFIRLNRRRTRKGRRRRRGCARPPAVEELRNRTIAAVAGGVEKVEALRAVLRSGLPEGPIADEATGRSLVAGEPGTAAPKPRAP